MTGLGFVGSVSVLFIYVTDAIRCLKCDDVQDPFECNTIYECWPSEECFLRQYINNYGDILYSMGCTPRERCDFQKRSSGDLVTCLKCCDSDYCNLEGCHTAPSPLTQRGPKCFSCPVLLRPDLCTVTTSCSHGNACGLVHSSGKYTSRCISKEQCESILKVESLGAIDGVYTGCNLCCTDDFCNDKCRNITITKGTSPSSIMVPTHAVFSTSSAGMTSLITYTSDDHRLGHSTPRSITTTPIKGLSTTVSPDREALCKQQGYSYDVSTTLCLKVVHAPRLNWTLAADGCEAVGGQLVVIAGESNKVTDIMHYLKSRTPDESERYWTLVTDTSRVHTFTFPDGKTIAFNKGHNGDLTNANCLLIGIRGISPTPCTQQHSYICENSNFIRA